MDKRSTDVLKSRGFWAATVGGLLQALALAFTVWLRETYGIIIPEEIVMSVIIGIAALFGINIAGYKLQDARRALNEAPKG